MPVPASHGQSSKSKASTAQLLPAEIWHAVLDALEPSALQHTALALSRAIPNAEGVSDIRHLWRHVCISRDVQVTQLVLKLRRLDSDARKAVNREARSITGLAWRTDSNILVNVVTALPSLRCIDLNVGPLFAPEHLEELVEKERPALERLALRFNPYVDKASYTIFLKGLYFDTGILRLARWPVTPSFKQLSLVQDPIPSFADLVAAALESGVKTPEKAHAQPIVFFKLSCLSSLATAPIAAHISSVRLRIPNRSILTAVSTASTGGSTVLPATHSATLPRPFPALEHLDISTTYVNCDAAFQGLLKRHPGLTHLVADRSGLIRFGMAELTCTEIGKVVASIGVARATEAMKVYRAASRTQQARRQAEQQARQQALMAAGQAEGRAHLTDLERLVNSEVGSSRRGRSSYATQRRNRTAAGTSSLNGLDDAFAGLTVTYGTKPVVLPSAPSLTSLGCGVSDHEGLDADMREEWDHEFLEGFEAGLERTLAFIDEKLEEFHRLTVRAQNATHKSPAEDRLFPKLYRFRTPEERKALQAAAAEQGCAVEDLPQFKDKEILSTLDLVPCDVADVPLLMDQVRNAKCSLCTLPDCAAEGRIVSTDSGEKDAIERSKWRRPPSEHKPGCAHLLGRSLWESNVEL